jgi:hypothetical protein
MTEDLTTAILRIFDEHNDVLKVAEQLDLDPAVVRYHLTKEGRKLPKGSYRLRRGPKGAAISQFHAAVGAKISYLRAVANKSNIADFAYECGISTKKYGFIEKGTTDATLGDIQRIARVLGVTPWELMTPLALQ